MVPCIVRLLAFLEQAYIPKCRTSIGLSSIKGGRKEYRSLIAHYTMPGLSEHTLYKIGLREIKLHKDKLNKLSVDDIDKYQYKKSKDIHDDLKKIESKLRNRKELQIAGKLSKKDTYSIQEVQKDDHFSTAYYVPPSKLKKEPLH